MAYAKLQFLLLGVLLVFGNGVKGDFIPDYLRECYSNTSLLYRENRLPMTIGTLVEIIRKVELGTTMDMRNLASSLLYMFRVDGIEYMPDVLTQTGVLPFGVQGDDRFKWGLIRETCLARPNVAFPNDTITAMEKCTLHFMLSKSVESLVRGDEGLVCNNLRTRRDVPGDEHTDIDNAESSKDGGEKLIPVETDSGNQTSSDADGDNVEETESKLSTNYVDETSEVILATPGSNSTNANTEKILMTPSTNSSTENNVLDSAESNITEVNQAVEAELLSTKRSKNIETKGELRAAENGLDISTCPIENGVIYTKFGSVNIGNVIAGIATGLNPMEVSRADFKFKNVWAATLAGDAAEVATYQGPKSDRLVIGADGGWNNTALPRHYFLKQNEKLELTKAELLGGLDGLIIANNIMSWNDKYEKGLRLSELLSLYYSEDGVISKDARSCDRKSNFSIIVPLQEASNQTYGFSRAYSDESETPEISDEVLRKNSNNAASTLIAFVPNMQQIPCATNSDLRPSINVTRNVDIDLYIIIDRKWMFNEIRTLLMQIADKIDLYNSRTTAITIIAGDGFQTIINSTRSVNDLFQLFNESSYNGGGQAMDLKSLLEKDLFNYFSSQLDKLKQKNEGVGPSTVVLFLPQGAINLDDTSLNAAQKAVSNYKSVIPDLHFIYYVSSGGDRLNSLVENPSADIITYSFPNDHIFDIDKLIARLGQGKRRIFNPVCGATGKTQSYSNVNYNEYIPWKRVNYYKLSPKYLFGVTSGNIKVRENGNGKVRICYSREVEEPLWSSSVDSRVTCLIASYNDSTIPLSSPCGNYEFYYQCPPLYASIEGLDTSFRCRDSGCRLRSDVLVSISHEGLTCGVGCILSSKSLLIIGIIVLLKNIVSIN